MRSDGYESVNKEAAPPAALDGATMRLAVTVSVLSFSVSLLAIAFVVWSLPF